MTSAGLKIIFFGERSTQFMLSRVARLFTGSFAGSTSLKSAQTGVSMFANNRSLPALTGRLLRKYAYTGTGYIAIYSRLFLSGTVLLLPCCFPPVQSLFLFPLLRRSAFLPGTATHTLRYRTPLSGLVRLACFYRLP